MEDYVYGASQDFISSCDLLHCTRVGTLGEFMTHDITALHAPGISIIRLKETIRAAFLGTAWAVPSHQRSSASFEMALNGPQPAVAPSTSTEPQLSFLL